MAPARVPLAIICALGIPRGVDAWARIAEKEALIAMYEAMGGADWFLGPNAPDDHMLQPGGNNFWDIVSSDPCPLNYTESWNGVACIDPCYYPIDGEDCYFGRITGLQLQHNNLKGTIPEVLFDKLVNLTIVDFTDNQISGTIPTQIGKLRNVAIFQVARNSLSGTIPTEIRTIGSHVGPDENALALEDIPAEQLANPDMWGYENENVSWPEGEGQNSMGLHILDLSNNNLNGTIPTTIGELVNLVSLDVSSNIDLGADGCCETTDEYYNSFYGYNTTIPTQIGVLSKLQLLKMDHARFMRHIPTEIGGMRSLMYWRLRGSWETNQVSGTIPSQIGKMKRLTDWYMDNNTLSGTIPPELGDTQYLETFRVDENKLSGTLPNIFGSLSRLQYWDTFGNKLSGDMPESIGEVPDLQYLYIQNEHSDALRNHYCQQRIDNSAIGRKYNWVVLGDEYMNYKHLSACANPYDVEQAFGRLSGDV